MFNRDELQEIRDRAHLLENETYTNPFWNRAFADLADATDRLHAMMVRGGAIIKDESQQEGD